MKHSAIQQVLKLLFLIAIALGVSILLCNSRMESRMHSLHTGQIRETRRRLNILLHAMTEVHFHNDVSPQNHVALMATLRSCSKCRSDLADVRLAQIDAWKNPIVWELSSNGNVSLLVSTGADGHRNTPDDIVLSVE